MAFFCIWMLTFIPSASHAEGAAASGLMSGYQCYPSFKHPSEKTTCEVSPIALIADPQRFDGVNIQATGYLRRIEGKLVLFPSKDVYLFSAGRGGIELMGASGRIIELLDKGDECTQPVTVIGDFTYQTRGSVSGSVGVFHGELNAYVQEMPGEPPKPPRKENQRRH